jgi:hypothetical protein
MRLELNLKTNGAIDQTLVLKHKHDAAKTKILPSITPLLRIATDYDKDFTNA